MRIYNGIIQGLREAIKHNKGEVKAETKTMYKTNPKFKTECNKH